MELTKGKKFRLAVAFQLAVIFGIVLYKIAIVTGGAEVLLKIRPVDPRDLLRGDYVTFQYDISTLNTYLFQGQTFEVGETVYVPLRRQWKFWIAIREVSSEKPKGGVFLKGKVSRVSGSRIDVVYGLEEYFIPEGTGRGIRPGRGDDDYVLVAVDKNGNGVIKKIYIDDRPWPE